jgi:hypothetical protein
LIKFSEENNIKNFMPWRRYIVVSTLPATEVTGAMGREIESRPGVGELKNLVRDDLFLYFFVALLPRS